MDKKENFYMDEMKKRIKNVTIDDISFSLNKIEYMNLLEKIKNKSKISLINVIEDGFVTKENITEKDKCDLLLEVENTIINNVGLYLNDPKSLIEWNQHLGKRISEEYNSIIQFYIKKGEYEKANVRLLEAVEEIQKLENRNIDETLDDNDKKLK